MAFAGEVDGSEVALYDAYIRSSRPAIEYLSSCIIFIGLNTIQISGCIYVFAISIYIAIRLCTSQHTLVPTKEYPTKVPSARYLYVHDTSVPLQLALMAGSVPP